MNATEFKQIVVDPEDKTASLMLALAAKVDDSDIPRRAWAKLWLGRFLHPVGIHTWVRWMHYDKASDTVLDAGGEVCQFCPKARFV